MPQVLVQFSEATLRAIDRVAASSTRNRGEFIRRAVKDALFRLDAERMHEAYRLQPNSIEGADVWEMPEEWKE